MPSHKRQHYVPRCYLKPFSLGGCGAAIRVFNITKRKSIRAAPVKGQCAKDYFYGENLELEKALQNVEGHYGAVLNKIIKTPNEVDKGDLAFLLEFSYLQLRRTDMAIQRMRISHLGLQNAVFEGREMGDEELDLSDRALMIDSMIYFLETKHLVSDLKVCLLKNETGIDFVTSDDPTIFTNRFYLQRLHASDFGAASSGALYILPLTPKISLMGYDGMVYTVPEKKGLWISLKADADVLALNELQYLKAAENIYFSNWNDVDRVKSDFEAASERRPDSWCQITVLVRDGEDARGVRYRPATDEERITAQHAAIHMSARYPMPSQWPKILTHRRPPRTFSNGTAVGHVRMREWLKGSLEQPIR